MLGGIFIFIQISIEHFMSCTECSMLLAKSEDADLHVGIQKLMSRGPGPTVKVLIMFCLLTEGVLLLLKRIGPYKYTYGN